MEFETDQLSAYTKRPLPYNEEHGMGKRMQSCTERNPRVKAGKDQAIRFVPSLIVYQQFKHHLDLYVTYWVDEQLHLHPCRQSGRLVLAQ